MQEVARLAGAACTPVTLAHDHGIADDLREKVDFKATLLLLTTHFTLHQLHDGCSRCTTTHSL